MVGARYTDGAVAEGLASFCGAVAVCDCVSVLTQVGIPIIKVQDMSENCIFCKIASKQIPVEALYEDDNFIAFRDLAPQAPVHVLLIPKVHIETIMELSDPELMAGSIKAVQATAKALNLVEEGFRTVINCRENGGQTVYHLHFHLLGGRFMQWPPG